MTLFQKFATAALVSVIVLIFVGAIVRVTGAGMGCPDWPKCWGRYIPPTKVEDVDLSKVDFSKFERAAKRYGRDPATVTPEHILENFNPVHTWTEYINRLSSLPVGFFSVATMVLAFSRQRRRPWVVAASVASVILVGVNAWMGKEVVSSDLKPGVLTIHMALAMILILPLSYAAWAGTERRWRIPAGGPALFRMRMVTVILLLLIFAEGVLGTQIREMNTHLAKTHPGMGRAEWIGVLESSWEYLVHRSFSWGILGTVLLAWWWMKAEGRPGKIATGALAVVIAQMVLGLIMSQVEIHPVVQVAHLGLSAILLALVTVWVCGTGGKR
ncbi:COX15/CtaA family protein [Luteolibacter sp. GHJ8]|uniref:COX15/CtaA family protein n=1 Tax=Luteolibacter rhizosphaerae TaxID=2989719 RepID=A0ABT3G2D5_9BACT|nr:COX15/CtaA family protein [Luteolibacter rhizosphaerae]MCW1914003.1 COX15/CtaA family protein [Luteolibacter rhizosphaerae]